MGTRDPMSGPLDDDILPQFEYHGDPTSHTTTDGEERAAGNRAVETEAAASVIDDQVRVRPDGTKAVMGSVLQWHPPGGDELAPLTPNSMRPYMSTGSAGIPADGRGSSTDLTEIMRRLEMLEAERRLLMPPPYAPTRVV